MLPSNRGRQRICQILHSYFLRFQRLGLRDVKDVEVDTAWIPSTIGGRTFSEKGKLPSSVPDHPYRAYTEELLEDLRPYMPGRRPVTQKKLGMLLQKRGCRKFNQIKRGWEFPDLREAREEWAKQMGARLVWDNNDKDWGE
jgi:hypothetical protein